MLPFHLLSSSLLPCTLDTNSNLGTGGSLQMTRSDHFSDGAQDESPGLSDRPGTG